MKIAYLTTQYPAVSHSFIRREILGVEAAGGEVKRYSIRRPAPDLPDPTDQAEAALTEVVLAQGIAGLLLATVVTAMTRPIGFVRALGCAFAMYRASGHTLIRHCAYLVEAAWLARRLRASGIAHLHVHFGTNPTAVARLARLLGGPPYSFTVHGPDEFDNPRGLDLHGKIADAAFCVGISSFGRSQLMRWSDYRDWPRIAVVRCGVDASFTAPMAIAPVEDVSRLCCVARLSAQKGLPVLIEAAAAVKARGVDFHLTLVGDGEMRREIEAQIHAFDLRDAITITGWASAETVRREISSARAMVLPSFAEGLPVVIMEALALERPVIVSAIAGTPELVDSECGWLVPAGDIDALTNAMMAALAAPVEKIATMGSEGRARVLARHDASRNGGQMLALFQAAAEDRGQ